MTCKSIEAYVNITLYVAIIRRQPHSYYCPKRAAFNHAFHTNFCRIRTSSAGDTKPSEKREGGGDCPLPSFLHG
ncbi:hypothetical protein D3H35_15435 [Cohnella faecalis]|uniref:Uncharacterized protein n=1 Tax=Cohnella faecalis TaxID=2315694 RepID=A0A398CT56_9BACL|nr:hypothetical protein D3H35_15435 [Cohnella faecalis]